MNERRSAGVRRATHRELIITSLFKRFAIHENLNLEVRAEFFNVTNTVQFGGPSTSLNSSQFGVIALSEVNDPRIIQLAMKLRF